MKTLIKYSLKLALILTLISVTSCAVKKNWVSTPESAKATSDYYEATITPEKDGNRFYSSFRLEVANKSNKELQIDWNKTMYVNNGRVSGVFIFKGIKPEDIKNLSIPDEVVAPGAKFTKNISPFSMVAKSPLKSSKDKTYSPGILPNGRNGINLAIKQGGKGFVEKLSFVISEVSE
jgi:hypothetical protein